MSQIIDSIRNGVVIPVVRLPRKHTCSVNRVVSTNVVCNHSRRDLWPMGNQETSQ